MLESLLVGEAGRQDAAGQDAMDLDFGVRGRRAAAVLPRPVVQV